MSDYRCFFLNEGKQIVDVEEIRDCRNDDEARRIALALLQERPQHKGVSVWDRARKIFEEVTV